MSSFDPVTYKENPRQQWDTVADAWHKWIPVVQRWMGPVTESMLDLARVVPGSRVLDVAAGDGDQSLTVAKRVGPKGHVLATDIAGSYDAVICRLGLFFLPSLSTALVEMRRVLKPGGRIGAIVFSTPEKNPFFSIPISLIRQRAQLPPPRPGQPGPFSLGAPGALEQAFANAGFREVEAHQVAAPLRMVSAAECVQFERESFGALQQMLGGLNDAERERAWREIEQALSKYDGPAGFESPCEVIVGVGVK
jgi:hypothetical protein